MNNSISPKMKSKIKVGQQLLRKFNQQGYDAYFVGGFVRDILLHRFFQLDDIDITTNMPVEIVKQQFSVVYQAEHFGMVCIEEGGYHFEVTHFRTDGAYVDGRRPESVAWVKTLAEDVKRRDFTINGLGMDANLVLFDYVQGQNDLKNKIIRTIGDADERFQEDSLRIIRALRFASNLDFTIDKQTQTAILNNRYRLRVLPLARIQLEIKKIKSFSRFLSMLREYELYDFHSAFLGVKNILIDQDLLISSWEDFCFFQVYMSKQREKTYIDLEFGKQTRRQYEILLSQISIYKNTGQTAWWNYQLAGDTRVFKFLALLYKRPYNEYVQKYQMQEIKTWSDIAFDMRMLQFVPNKEIKDLKEKIAFDVIHGKVENQTIAIKKYVQEVYGWK